MDRISRLPDDVICRILSFLPTKHSVATSILSSRWLNLWSFVNVIDLEYTQVEDSEEERDEFVRFVDRVLSLNHSQTILKFRLVMHCRSDEETLSKINGFIQNIIMSRNQVVEIELSIRAAYHKEDYYYLTIPNSQSLKVLKVETWGYHLDMPAFPGCFPSLRVFQVSISHNNYDDERITNLFSSLPAALEKLCLHADIFADRREYSFNIGGAAAAAAALTHLELKINNCYNEECDVMVVIDAPKLDYLCLQDGSMASYMVKHKPALSEVRLDLGPPPTPQQLTRFDELLRGLVNTKFLWVNAVNLQVSSGTHDHQLPNLTKLELHVPPAGGWIQLLHWLQICPNLKVLSVIISEYSLTPYEFEEAMPHDVPSCLSSCIKEIEIKSCGEVDLEEMLTYLLENAKVLDNFTVDSRVYLKDGISHVVG